MPMRAQRGAAARTAVADGVEPAEHRVLEERVVDVAAIVLGGQDRDRLVRTDPARPVGLVLADEAGKRFTDDQADVHRRARLCTRGAAGTHHGDDMVGCCSTMSRAVA